MFDKAAHYLGYVVLDSEKDIKALTIEFSNGTKIHALSSNPKAFRSKGGKVVLDEFAHHDDQNKMWAAAKPCITWGYPMRILSTHNGMSCRFYKFIDSIRKDRLHWSLHTTPIQQAVDEGLYDKILGRAATTEEKQAWLERLREDCFDENTWLQEYCCIPIDEATAFLTYEMISNCELDDVLQSLDNIQGDLYVGMDIARRRHLSVIWALEKLGNVKYTRAVKVLENAPFQAQREALFEFLSHPNMRRACLDATGIGMQLAEEAQEAFGKYRVEAVTFTPKVKEDIAYSIRINFEDRTIYIPKDYDVREDLHSVREITTSSNAIRFDVAATDNSKSHADRFWALGLANHAASDKSSGPVHIATRWRRESYDFLRGY